MKNRFMKRVGSIVLALALVLGMIQVPSLSAKAEGETTTTYEVSSHSDELQFGGNWNVVSESAGDIAYTEEAGATVSYSFVGTGITWIGQKDTNFGSAKVTLDDGEAVEVSCYGSGSDVHFGHELFKAENLEDGIHTITIEAVQPVIDIEKFVVTQNVKEADVISEDVWALDGEVVLEGSWTKSPNEGTHGIYYTSTPNATASLTFYGTGIKWIGQREVNFGIAEVLIDGEVVDTVDCYASAAWGQELFVKDDLEEGVHTITIRVTGEKNAASEAPVIDVEKFIVTYDQNKTILASNVIVQAEETIVKPGETTTVSAIVQPYNAYSKDVTFTSSNESLATVDENGLVTVVNGSNVPVTITAKALGASGSVDIECREVYTVPAFDNSGNYIDLPTHYDRYYEMGDNHAAPEKHIPGQVTHPDVVFVDGGFGGHEYWMIYTPNVMVTSQFENPYIVYSDDGINWSEPLIDGKTINPISPRETEMNEADTHNCDGDMVYDAKNDRLIAYWNWTDDNGSRGSQVQLMVSYDGIHWGAPVEGKEAEKEIVQGEFAVAVSSPAAEKYNLLSPTITYDSYRDIYLMYYTNAGGVGYNNGQRNTVDVLVSEDGINWPETSEGISVKNFLGKDQNGSQLAPWHQDIQYIPELNEYWALSQCFAGPNPDGSVLYMTKSKDGLNWQQVGTEPVLTPNEAPFWNDFQIYRSTFWYDAENDEINIWYSALQGNTANKLVQDSNGEFTITAGTDDSRVWRIGYVKNDRVEVMKSLLKDEFYTDPAVVNARGYKLTAEDPTIEVGETVATKVVWGIGNDIVQEVTDMNIKFTSDDESVAVVDPWGNVTGVGDGVAIIRGETKQGCETDFLITVGEQPKVEARHVVDNEHPLYLSNYYWSDGAPANRINNCDWGQFPEQNYITLEYNEDGTRVDRDDPLKLWNSIPDELKDNTVILLISERSIRDDVIKAGTTDVNAVRDWYKTQVEFCNAHQIPCAVQNINGETNTFDRITLSFWKELAENNEYLVGFNGAELYNRFSGGENNNGDEYVADLIRLGASLGVSMMWTDTNVFGQSGVLMDWLQEENSVLGEAMLDNNEYISLMYKESYGNPSTDALFLGLWLTGYCDSWGVASDWWHWQLDGNNGLFGAQGNVGGWIDTLYWVENLYSQDIIRVASYGATGYKSEPQWYSVATNGHRTPAYQYSVMPTLMNICDGTFDIPTKEEVLERTKVVVKGTEDFSAAIYNTYYSQLYPKTGQYGIVPLVPNTVSNEQLEELGFEVIVDGTRLTEDMLKAAYPDAKYEGTAWAENWGDTWYMMNSSENRDVEQYAKVGLDLADLTVNMEPHAYAVAIEDEAAGEIDLYLSNYRLDKSELLTGEYRISGMQTVYEYIWEMYERMEENAGLDSELRTTTITIHSEEKPVVTFREVADAYDYDEYGRPFAASEVTGEAGAWVVTVEHNGFVEGTIAYEVDEPVVPPVVVNKAALEAAVEATETLVEDDYTAETWAALETAVAAAEAVLEDADATQEEVDAAAKAVADAVAALEKAEEPVVPPVQEEVDKTELKAAVEAAKKLVEADYTAETWAALEAAIEDAEAVLADEDATEAEVAYAEAVLDAAVKNLKEATTEDVQKPSEDDKEENKPATGDKEDKDESPATGDSASIVLWAMVMVAAAAVVVFRRKRA